MTPGSDPVTLFRSRPTVSCADVGPHASQTSETAPAWPGTTQRTWPLIPARDAGLDEWFLTADERGNSATRLDSRHRDGAAWTTGNQVRPLHGAAYFSELLAAIRAMDPGDLLLFTDWRGDPDERLNGPGTEVSRVLAEAAGRGVIVRGLLWRSHLDRFRFSLQEHRDLGKAIVAAGGECLLDMRVRARGSHHQKLVVLRHRAGLSGMWPMWAGSTCATGAGMTATTAAMSSPARSAPLTVLARRGMTSRSLSMARPWPMSRRCSANGGRIRPRGAATRCGAGATGSSAVPGQPRARSRCPTRPGAAPTRCRCCAPIRTGAAGTGFAPSGERSIARAYRKALDRAQRLVYVEDQYLWCPRVVGVFAEALAAKPDLKLIAVVPQFPVTGLNQEWRPTASAAAPQLLARARSLDLLQRLGGDRVAVYGVENHAGTPVYVHAKVCVIDDAWATVGSGNINLRSWTYDSELSCAVVGRAPDGSFLAQRLRLDLAREHLDRAECADADLRDPQVAFDAFAASARRLDDWYAGGQRGPRPPGRLRRHHPTPLPAFTQRWAEALYRILYDPEGRPRPLRRVGGF